MDETNIGGSKRVFPTTLWTTVLEAKNPTASNRQEALGRLITSYWKPVYFFLRRKGYNIETSKDYTQGFFATFLERDFLKYVDRERGKFRTFLLLALEHYLADEYDRATALKRGGGITKLSLDFVEAEEEFPHSVKPEDSAEKVYQRQWALLVLERALQAVQEEFEAVGRTKEFELIRLYLGVGGTPSHAEISEKLGISVANVKIKLHRARKRYREAILNEIRVYTAGEDAALEELQELFTALS